MKLTETQLTTGDPMWLVFGVVVVIFATVGLLTALWLTRNDSRS